MRNAPSSGFDTGAAEEPTQDIALAWLAKYFNVEKNETAKRLGVLGYEPEHYQQLWEFYLRVKTEGGVRLRIDYTQDSSGVGCQGVERLGPGEHWVWCAPKIDESTMLGIILGRSFFPFAKVTIIEAHPDLQHHKVRISQF